MTGPDEGTLQDAPAALLARTDVVPTAGFEAGATVLPVGRRAYAAQAFGGWDETYRPGFQDGVLDSHLTRPSAPGP